MVVVHHLKRVHAPAKHFVVTTPLARPVRGRPQQFICGKLRRQGRQALHVRSAAAVEQFGSADQPGTGANGANGQSNGALAKQDFAKFVGFFRSASPYIAGHRGRTFVIVLPGEVVADQQLLQSLVADVSLLHGLGVRLVLVLGAQPRIDEGLQARGMEPSYIRGYRVTDEVALQVAIEAAGAIRTRVEQYLSKAQSVPMMRRHNKTDQEIHYGPAFRTVSGNFVAAKRRGVYNGVDFKFTGEVRFVMGDLIRQQLDADNIVLLSNLGYTASGEVLNCNTYDVGMHAAVELDADKLFCLHLDDVADMHLPHWLPLSDARKMLQEKSAQRLQQAGVVGEPPRELRDDQIVNLDTWFWAGVPLSACVAACVRGVKRAHLVDARIDGGLLLELYCRDGVGTMISTDFYEGIRKARPADLDAIESLLKPLVAQGVLVERSRSQLNDVIHCFTVIEREAKVLGCAMLSPLGKTADGVSVAEIGAFCVDTAFRGSGRGDSLLDYLEQEARFAYIGRLVLLTTRTADWFAARDFRLAGSAWSSELLPDERRIRVDPARNSQLYVKDLEPPDKDNLAPGKRIGF